ncbi:Ig-like domain-containing protein [Metabacillus sp. cB07]|uniref:Ig-like domain-containing protein n=1 Tax=Metabacillus sp. cB07 TaxID=2806989 RepID=UPI0019397264|nr:Ig-like domain-containing protein [Metabacillus sp. cB07]
MRKIILLLMITCLISGSLTGFAEETKTGKEVTSNLTADQKPKQEISAEKDAFYQPDDYPLVGENQYIGTLIDSLNAYHYLTFGSLTDYSDEMMKLSLTYLAGSSTKEGLLTLEFFRDDNGTLTYLTQTTYSTSWYNNATLSLELPKYLYEGEPYIYVRAGTSASQSDTYYSDTLKFKAVNPDFTEEPQSGQYAIISNESYNAEDTQPSGTFQVNNENYTFDKKLKPEVYQMDADLPFNPEAHKNKLFSKKQAEQLPDYQTGAQKNFWVSDFRTNGTYQLNATLMHSGSKTNIWVNDHQITAEDAEKLSKEFDSSIHPTVVNHFAEESDVDNDGKINILVFDIQDGFSGSGGYIAGYFYARDLYNMSGSNQSEIFYIDSYPLMGSGSEKLVEASYSTLAHEFQHMVNFNQNVFIEGNYSNMDTWLNEALSMAAEQIYTGEALTSRINYYNASNSIKNGHSLLYWDYSGDTLSNYSLSYLFGQYLRVQANQGNEIFKEVLKNPNNDYLAVEQTIQKYMDPSLSFGTFMTNFRAALLLKSKTGPYGFKGESAFNALSERLYTGSYTYLRGGGAVVKKSDSTAVPADKGADVTYTFVGPADTAAPSAPAVNLVSDHDNAVTGSTEPNAMVYVKKGSETLGSSPADTNGDFTVGIQVQKAGTELKVYAEDNAGNKSAETSVTVQDWTAPAKPDVQPVADNQTAVTGKAEAGSKVYIRKGETVIGNASASGSGTFSVTIAKQSAGTMLAIYAEDAAGNRSEEASIKVLDKTAPQTPSVQPVGDHQTAVTGKTEGGATVTVKKGTAVLGENKAAANGDFSVNIQNKQTAGTVLSVYVKDAAGNQSPAASVTVADKTAPAKPTVNPVGDNQTVVTGKTEAGATITVKNGAAALGDGKAAANGNFSVTIQTKQAAGTTLSVYAKDAAGNQSSASTITVSDKTAPAKPSVNPVGDNQTAVTGKAEAGSTVTVKKDTVALGEGKAAANGDYSVAIQAKQPAGTILTVSAKDAAGNQSATSTVTVTDKTAPAKPAVNPVGDNQTIVTGKTEAGSSVLIKKGTSALAEGKAAANGDFTLDLKSLQTAGTLLTVFAKDASGNQSEPLTITVLDKTAPARPAVDPVEENQTTVTGKAEANTVITVTKNDILLGEAKTDATGTFKVDIKSGQTSGTTLSISAKDAAGNQSASTLIQVIKNTVPAKPVLEPVSDNSTIIKGKTSPNATVFIQTIRASVIGKSKADSTGQFTVTLSAKPEAGKPLFIYSVSEQGKRSPLTKIKVVDKTAPSAPTVKKLSSRSKFVSGKSEQGATVYVYKDQTLLGKQKVTHRTGVYRVKISIQKKGTVLSVHAIDAAGNKGSKKEVTVLR